MSDSIRESDVDTAPLADEGFLQRWSRRKHLEAEGRPVEDEPAAEQSPVLLDEEQVQAPVLTDADMPPVETLDEESDYTGFMSPGVSDQLRNLALRKLFHIPAFNIRDGLDDYDGDYTSFLKLGDIITCDMKHMLEVEARKEAEKLLAEQQAENQQDMATAQLSDAQLEETAEETGSEQTDFEEDEWCEEIDDVENMG